MDAKARLGVSQRVEKNGMEAPSTEEATREVVRQLLAREQDFTSFVQGVEAYGERMCRKQGRRRGDKGPSFGGPLGNEAIPPLVFEDPPTPRRSPKKGEQQRKAYRQSRLRAAEAAEPDETVGTPNSAGKGRRRFPDGENSDADQSDAAAERGPKELDEEAQETLNAVMSPSRDRFAEFGSQARKDRLAQLLTWDTPASATVTDLVKETLLSKPPEFMEFRELMQVASRGSTAASRLSYSSSDEEEEEDLAASRSQRSLPATSPTNAEKSWGVINKVRKKLVKAPRMLGQHHEASLQAVATKQQRFDQAVGSLNAVLKQRLQANMDLKDELREMGMEQVLALLAPSDIGEEYLSLMRARKDFGGLPQRPRGTDMVGHEHLWADHLRQMAQADFEAQQGKQSSSVSFQELLVPETRKEEVQRRKAERAKAEALVKAEMNRQLAQQATLQRDVAGDSNAYGFEITVSKCEDAPKPPPAPKPEVGIAPISTAFLADRLADKLSTLTAPISRPVSSRSPAAAPAEDGATPTSEAATPPLHEGAWRRVSRLRSQLVQMQDVLASTPDAAAPGDVAVSHQVALQELISNLHVAEGFVEMLRHEEAHLDTEEKAPEAESEGGATAAAPAEAEGPPAKAAPKEAKAKAPKKALHIPTASDSPAATGARGEEGRSHPGKTPDPPAKTPKGHAGPRPPGKAGPPKPGPKPAASAAAKPAPAAAKPPPAPAAPAGKSEEARKQEREKVVALHSLLEEKLATMEGNVEHLQTSYIQTVQPELSREQRGIDEAVRLEIAKMAQRPQITKTQLLAERFKDLVANGRTAKSGTREALIEDASSQLQDLLDLLLMDYRKMLGIETRRKSTFLDLKDAHTLETSRPTSTDTLDPAADDTASEFLGSMDASMFASKSLAEARAEALAAASELKATLVSPRAKAMASPRGGKPASDPAPAAPQLSPEEAERLQQQRVSLRAKVKALVKAGVFADRAKPMGQRAAGLAEHVEEALGQLATLDTAEERLPEAAERLMRTRVALRLIRTMEELLAKVEGAVGRGDRPTRADLLHLADSQARLEWLLQQLAVRPFALLEGDGDGVGQATALLEFARELLPEAERALGDVWFRALTSGRMDVAPGDHATVAAALDRLRSALAEIRPLDVRHKGPTPSKGDKAEKADGSAPPVDPRTAVQLQCMARRWMRLAKPMPVEWPPATLFGEKVRLQAAAVAPRPLKGPPSKGALGTAGLAALAALLLRHLLPLPHDLESALLRPPEESAGAMADMWSAARLCCDAVRRMMAVGGVEAKLGLAIEFNAQLDGLSRKIDVVRSRLALSPSAMEPLEQWATITSALLEAATGVAAAAFAGPEGGRHALKAGAVATVQHFNAALQAHAADLLARPSLEDFDCIPTLQRQVLCLANACIETERQGPVEAAVSTTALMAVQQEEQRRIEHIQGALQRLEGHVELVVDAAQRAAALQALQAEADQLARDCVARSDVAPNDLRATESLVAVFHLEALHGQLRDAYETEAPDRGRLEAVIQQQLDRLTSTVPEAILPPLEVNALVALCRDFVGGVTEMFAALGSNPGHPAEFTPAMELVGELRHWLAEAHARCRDLPASPDVVRQQLEAYRLKDVWAALHNIGGPAQPLEAGLHAAEYKRLLARLKDVLADGAQEEVPGVAEEDLALRMERLQMQYVWEQLRLGQMSTQKYQEVEAGFVDLLSDAPEKAAEATPLPAEQPQAEAGGGAEDDGLVQELTGKRPSALQRAFKKFTQHRRHATDPVLRAIQDSSEAVAVTLLQCEVTTLETRLAEAIQPEDVARLTKAVTDTELKLAESRRQLATHAVHIAEATERTLHQQLEALKREAEKFAAAGDDANPADEDTQRGLEAKVQDSALQRLAAAATAAQLAEEAAFAEVRHLEHRLEQLSAALAGLEDRPAAEREAQGRRFEDLLHATLRQHRQAVRRYGVQSVAAATATARAAAFVAEATHQKLAASPPTVPAQQEAISRAITMSIALAETLEALHDSNTFVVRSLNVAVANAKQVVQRAPATLQRAAEKLSELEARRPQLYMAGIAKLEGLEAQRDKLLREIQRLEQEDRLLEAKIAKVSVLHKQVVAQPPEVRKADPLALHHELEAARNEKKTAARQLRALAARLEHVGETLEHEKAVLDRQMKAIDAEIARRTRILSEGPLSLERAEDHLAALKVQLSAVVRLQKQVVAWEDHVADVDDDVRAREEDLAAAVKRHSETAFGKASEGITRTLRMATANAQKLLQLVDSFQATDPPDDMEFGCLSHLAPYEPYMPPRPTTLRKEQILPALTGTPERVRTRIMNSTSQTARWTPQDWPTAVPPEEWERYPPEIGGRITLTQLPDSVRASSRGGVSHDSSRSGTAGRQTDSAPGAGPGTGASRPSTQGSRPETRGSSTTGTPPLPSWTPPQAAGSGKSLGAVRPRQRTVRPAGTRTAKEAKLKGFFTSQDDGFVPVYVGPHRGSGQYSAGEEEDDEDEEEEEEEEEREAAGMGTPRTGHRLTFREPSSPVGSMSLTHGSRHAALGSSGKAGSSLRALAQKAAALEAEGVELVLRPGAARRDSSGSSGGHSLPGLGPRSPTAVPPLPAMPLSPRPVARHPRVDFAAPAREPTFLPTPAGLPPVDNPHLPATLPYLDPDSPLANVVPHAPTGREVLWKQSVIWKVRKAMLQRQKESLAKRGERVALRAEDLEFRFNRLHDQFQNLRIAREEEEARSRESTASGVDATDGLEKEKDADNDKPGTRPSPPSTANSLAGFYARKMKKLDSQLGEIRAQLQQAFRARAQNLEPVPEEVKELEKPETPERANFICSPQKLIMARFRRTAGLRTRTPTPAEDGRKRLKKIEALADAATAQAAAQERRRHTETVVSELQRMYLKVGSLYRTLQVLGRAQSEEAEERFLQLYSEILCGEPEREPAGQLEVTLEAASPGPSPAAGRGGGRRRSKTLPPTGRAVSLTSPGKVKPIASPLSAGPRANRNAESSSAGPEGGTPPTAPLPTISIQAALTDAFVQAVESDALHYGPAYDTLVQMMLTLLMETFALYQNLARQSLQPPPLTLPTPQRRSPRPLPTRGSPDPELKVPASAATLAKPSGIFRLEEERLLPPDYKGFPPSPPRSTSPSPGRGHSPHSTGSSPRDLPHVTAQLRRASQRLHSEAEIVLFDGAPRRRRSVAVPRPEDGADWPSVSQAITPRLLEVEMDGAMFSTRSKTADDTDAETGSAFMTYLPSIWDRAEEAVRRRSKMQELEANVARTNDVFYLEKHLNDFFSPARAVPAAVPTLVARALGPSVSSSAPRTPATLPQLVPRGRGTAEQSARSGGPEGPRGSQRSRSAVVMSSREDRAEETLELGGILLEYRRDQKSSASHSHRSGESTQSGGLTGRSMGGTSSVRKLPQSPGSRATSRQLLAASTARAQVLSRQRSSPADMAISGTLPPLGRP